MKTQNNETPLATWATWALLAEAFKPGVIEPGSIAEFCVHRLAKFCGSNPDNAVKPGPIAFVILTSSGYWGRGNSLEAAALTAIKAGAGKRDIARAVLVVNDSTPEVNNGGSVISNSDSHQFNLGKVGTIGGLLETK